MPRQMLECIHEIIRKKPISSLQKSVSFRTLMRFRSTCSQDIIPLFQFHHTIFCQAMNFIPSA